MKGANTCQGPKGKPILTFFVVLLLGGAVHLHFLAGLVTRSSGQLPRLAEKHPAPTLPATNNQVAQLSDVEVIVECALGVSATAATPSKACQRSSPAGVARVTPSHADASGPNVKHDTSDGSAAATSREQGGASSARPPLPALVSSIAGAASLAQRTRALPML